MTTHDHAPTATADPPPARRLLRTALLTLSLGVVLGAGLLVPMPLVEAAPGAVTEVGPLLEVPADTTTELHGSLGLLTVRVDQPSVLETVRAWFDDQRVLRDRDDVIPTTLDQRTYIELQQQEFRRSFRVAAAVGLEAAGYEVGIETAPQVAGVMPGAPADGHLQVGDVIRRFDGTPVESADELIGLTRLAAVGDPLRLGVERGGEVLEVVVEAGPVPGLAHPGMGITLQTLEEDIVLPVEVELADQRGIGGPSAGLMVALTVYDLVAEEDLAAGRRIVGTGTVDGDGTVGRIGSIREKTFTAMAGGADVMLVPASQAAEARAAADGALEVLGVSTVEEAITALQR